MHTIHKDVQEYVSHYDEFYRLGKPTQKYEMPLQPKISLDPFDKWGFDLVGPLKPPSNKNKCILVCIEYLNQWVEFKDIAKYYENSVSKLFTEQIFTIFGVPIEVVSNQGIFTRVMFHANHIY